MATTYKMDSKFQSVNGLWNSSAEYTEDNIPIILNGSRCTRLRKGSPDSYEEMIHKYVTVTTEYGVMNFAVKHGLRYYCDAYIALLEGCKNIQSLYAVPVTDKSWSINKALSAQRIMQSATSAKIIGTYSDLSKIPIISSDTQQSMINSVSSTKFAEKDLLYTTAVASNFYDENYQYSFEIGFTDTLGQKATQIFTFDASLLESDVITTSIKSYQTNKTQEY